MTQSPTPEQWGAQVSEGIYLDHAATTPVDSEVFDAMRPFFLISYGNPSSVHAYGRSGRAGIDWARGTIANILNCRPREIIFTAGATEANNLALKGIAWRRRTEDPNRRWHIITTAIEHHAVLRCVESLAGEGFDVTVIPVGADGIVNPAEIETAIKPDTCLISVMYANNEIGTIQPINEISGIAAAHAIPFHCDAVQAAGALSLDVEQLGVQLLSLSAHKFYAPKGVGVLYVKDGQLLQPLIDGGGQELARRGGTENVPGIVGMGTALQRAQQEQEVRNRHNQCLRDALIDGLLEHVPDSMLNGDRTQRLPNNANFTFEGIDGESLLVDLDLHGISASSGSACASGSNEPSHVLQAIGLSADQAEGSLRLTVGKDNTVEDMQRAIEVVSAAVHRIRSLAM